MNRRTIPPLIRAGSLLALGLLLPPPAGSPGLRAAETRPARFGGVALVLDDGSPEDFIGCGQGGCRLVWVNTFRPEPRDFPFDLEEVRAVFPNFIEIGDTVRILIGEDPDGDGDPTDGALLRVAYAEVQANTSDAWNSFPLDPPLTLEGPGDVWIGLVNEAGTQWYPASLDLNDPKGRSWVGQWDADPLPDPPDWPPDNLWDRVDTLCQGCSGNWVLRGYGTSEGGLPGDCSGDGAVSIGEVQKAINMFLAVEPPACGADGNADGAVSIGEVQRVINAFLGVSRRVVLE